MTSEELSVSREGPGPVGEQAIHGYTRSNVAVTSVLWHTASISPRTKIRELIYGTNRVNHMRLSITVDPKLLEEAKSLAVLRTKREVIEVALSGFSQIGGLRADRD